MKKVVVMEIILPLFIFLLIIPTVTAPSVKLQGQEEVLDDVFVDDNIPWWNWDGFPLRVGTTPWNYRIYIKFNISSIPDGENITDARLYLYKFYYSKNVTRSVSAYHVYDYSWTEENLTYTNQPCGQDFNISTSCNLTEEDTTILLGSEDVNTTKSWSIIAAVSYEHDAGHDNISIVLKDDNEEVEPYGYSEFIHKEAPEIALIPYLIVNYTDSIIPEITITSPQNRTYATNLVYLNYSIDETNLDWTGYSLDGGDNVTTTGKITTFSDGSITKIMTFNSNETTYIRGPKNATVRRATMLISGDVGWSKYNDTTSFYTHAIAANPSAIDDQDWSSNTTGTNITSPDYIHEYYSIPQSDAIEINYYCKIKEMNTSSSENISVHFFDAGSPFTPPTLVWISNESGVQYPNITMESGDFVDEFNSTIVRIVLPTYHPNQSEADYFFEGMMRYKSYTKNVKIDTGNDGHMDWKYDPKLTPINSPQDVDLNVTAINDYVSSNKADSQGYVWIPLNISSDSPGIVELSSLSIDYYSNTTLNLSEDSHNVTVYASDTEGNLNSSSVYFTVNTTPPETNYTIALISGWNLISLPLVPENTSLDAVLASIEGNYTVVYSWTNDCLWKKSTAARNPLAEMGVEYGYWIGMTAPDTLELVGTVPTSTTINVTSACWNLVGYPSPTIRNLTDVLSPINYTVVYAYINGVWKKSTAARNPLTEMSPGYGYWIDANEDGSYEVLN